MARSDKNLHVSRAYPNFKHILERSPQADMNRTVLLIPALCGHPDAATLSNALVHARQRDLATWEHEHIPYTMRKKRQAFFAEDQSQKAGNS